MAKQTRMTAPQKGQRRPSKKQKGGSRAPPPEPAVANGTHDDVEVSDEDIAFVKQASKRLGFLEKFDAAAAARPTKKSNKKEDPAHAKPDAASGRKKQYEEDEKEVLGFERRPRTAVKETGPASQGLPTKALDGELISATTKLTEPKKITAAAWSVAGVQVQDAMVDAALQKDEEQAVVHVDKKRKKEATAHEQQQREAAQQQEEQQQHAAARVKSMPPVLASLQRFSDPVKRREAAQQAMAVAAHKLLERPDENMAELKILTALVADADSMVSRCAMLTATAVMKDIVPGYRIRPPTEIELQVKVTKDVQRLRSFEAALLSDYKVLLKSLQVVANGKPVCTGAAPPPIQHSRIALKSLCTLLCSLPHFNFTSDILQVVVPRLASKDLEMAEQAYQAVVDVIKQDQQGGLSREVVQLVADLVRRRKCVCSPRVVQCLFGLDFSDTQAEAAAVEAGKKGGKAQKRVKKRMKAGDEVDQAFRDADAAPDKRERAVFQSQTLEALFELLFRILKQAVACGSRSQAAQTWTRPDMDKKCPLLGISLSALSRYMYLASVEYFSDLMEVVKELARCTSFPLEERLGCLLAATQILRAQGGALTVDQRQFYVQLYNILLEPPVEQIVEERAEQSHAGSTTEPSGAAPLPVHGPPSQSTFDVISPNQAVLLSQLCNKMLCEVKMTDMGRLAAFLKRLTSISLHLSPAHSIGLVAVGFRLLQRYPKLSNLLEWEGEATVGGRAFNPDVPDPSEAGALATCLWDLNVLHRHYHPHVQQVAASLLSLSPGSTTQPSGLLCTARTPDALAELYDPNKMLFQVVLKKQRKQGRARQPLVRGNASDTLGVEAEAEEVEGEEADLSSQLKKFYRMNRCYDINGDLRRQHQEVTEQLHRLKMWVQQKQLG